MVWLVLYNKGFIIEAYDLCFMMRLALGELIDKAWSISDLPFAQSRSNLGKMDFDIFHESVKLNHISMT